MAHPTARGRAPRETGDDKDVGAGGTLIDVVAEWLVSAALDTSTPDQLLEGCCLRLNAAGVPVWRVSLGFRTLHPLFASISHTWRRGMGIETEGHQHGTTDGSEEWRHSPFYQILMTGVPFIRRHLTGPEALLDFPILDDLAEAGATDYLALAVEFGAVGGSEQERGDGIIVSWTTDRPGGYTENDIRSLIRIQKRLALACKVSIREQITTNILTTYLGPDAGRRVLHGQIRRGDGETTHAVIWFSDLRDSTPMADSMPPKEYLAAVNQYFECTAGAVLAEGGEVLRFVGDAVLAIFPIHGGKRGERAACRKALAAVGKARSWLAAVNADRVADGARPLAFGIGLHIGDVMFGNIGVPERLEFSVIGPAANEAARLETLTKTLKQSVLVSGEFADNLDIAWRPLGEHNLRGVGAPLEVFAPPANDGK